jgi:peroxiredoxin
MNKLRSFFIGAWPMLAMCIAIYGIYQLTTGGMNHIWLGAVLTTLPIMLFISRILMFKDIARTAPHFPLITIIAIVGITIAFYGFIRIDPENVIGIALAISGFVSYLLYNFWYSSFGVRNHQTLQKGKTLANFSAIDTLGNQVFSKSFYGAPAIFIFFRGNWCPLCMAQIKEMAEKYREISKTGTKVILIAPQPEKNTQALANKFDVPFVFLTDVDNKAAQILGIALPNGLPMGMEMFGYDKETVLPTVIITNAGGKIIYCDATENYRVRPEPEEFIKVLHENVQTI